MKKTIMTLCGLLATLAVAARVDAAEIYKWVDEEGVIHFSDTKPVDAASVESLLVHQTNAPDYNPTDDPYSIRNQAKRVGETWERLEKERDERQEKRREEALRQPTYVHQPYDPYYAGYRYPYYRPGIRPPSRPGYRPVRPGPTIRRQATALDELGLSGPRPHSINSGAHHARVSSSANFLDVARNSPPRPVPR
jgi:hypothetical protein